MAEFPALPLWTDAYIADCGHLTFAEHGAYLSLLLLMWRSPECRVPNDDGWIMRKLRCDADAMQTHVRSVIREFCEVDGNWITQKRLRKEWVWCRDKRQKNTEAAKSRWEKESKPSERNASAYANGMPPYPSLPTPFKEEKTITTENVVVVLGFDDFFKEYPRQINKSAAKASFLRALSKTTAQELVAAASRYAAHCKGYEQRFIQGPAKWLDEARWEDFPVKANGRIRDPENEAKQKELREKYGY